MNIKNTMYGGDIILNFNEFKHAYTIKVKDEARLPGDPVNGTKITSVTKYLGVIAKPALVNWSARMAVEHVASAILPGETYDEIQLRNIFEDARKAHWNKKTQAGDIGTFVHNWIEKYILGENPGMPVNEELQVAIQNFLVWAKKHKVKFLLSEQPIYSRKYQYAGIADFICKIDGKLYLGDFKTSSGIYPEYFLQTSAYRYARTEEYPKEDYFGQVIVRVGKDGSFETAKLSNTDTFIVDGNQEITGYQLYQRMFYAFLHAQGLQGTLDVLSSCTWDKE